MPDQTRPQTGILAGVGAAIYETTEDGAFVEPTPELAQFFLGPAATVEELSSRRVLEFYVSEDHRSGLMHRLRAARGEPISEVVHLRLFDGETWCHCRAVWHPALRHIRGIVIRLTAKHELVLDRLKRDAVQAALMLRESVRALTPFELGIVERLAMRTVLKAAAFYRHHPKSDLFILRAQRGLPEGCELKLSLETHSAGTFGAEGVRLEGGRRLTDPACWEAVTGVRKEIIEHLFPVADGEAPPLGLLWIPQIKDHVSHELDWVRAFAGALGSVARGAEEEAARRASGRALELSARILLSGDPTIFFTELLELVMKEVGAEAGSIFLVNEPADQVVLTLKCTSGLKGVFPTQYDSVSYRLGEGLTGSMARRKEAVSFLDVENQRKRLGIQPYSFIEDTKRPPQAWLGCPIRDEKEGLRGYIRLVNRRAVGGGAAIHSGFSDGDLKLVTALSTVARQHLELDEQRQEHQSVIARSLHELKAPLVAIRSNAIFLKKRPDTPAREVKIENILIDADVVLDLLGCIQAVSKAQVPKPRPTRLYQEVVVPLQWGLGELAKRRSYSKLAIEAEQLRGLPSLLLDRGMMRQVFNNLIVNAIKYGPESGGPLRVEIVTGEDDEYFFIYVRDWGMGIREQDQEQLFVQYFRAPPAEDRVPTGSGLGLTVARRVLEAHQGWIDVSEPGNPTEFKLAVPKSRRVKR